MARKQRFTDQLSVLLENEQYAELSAIAEKQEVSLGEVTRWVIRKGLVDYYKEGQPSVANS